ncbi:ATP-binding protein [Roseateles asaccharophilus]|uniref:histidine kinase n=1 Tax=Roseateles asaccharophilus TaxID=582607 RepID=A0ABU2A6Y5_9BURK|nr:ATP-binding protein [Roseateles asaccharophilus]MDR7332957.1 signal transduction histidine kinase/ActR/RegA family two-component response regulator [Roseateles asaccharophilus]
MTLSLLLMLGATESYFGYVQSVERIEFAQELQAHAAAREVAVFMESIHAGLRGVTKLPWTRPDFDVRERRQEFHRLMQGIPAVISLQAVDRWGRERLMISREAVDRVDTLIKVPEANLATEARVGEMRTGRTFFRDGALPMVRIGAADDQGGVVATVDLRLLGDIVSNLRLRDGALSYVLDGSGMLIAHPRSTHVLAQRDLSRSAVFSSARQAAASSTMLLLGVAAQDMSGEPVIATAVRIPGTDWMVVMEQARRLALRQAWATLTRTLALMALGGLAAVLIGVAFARRMAAPIVQLRNATSRIAAGDLATTLTVQRQDEIKDLANDFNRMVFQLRELYASLEAKVTERTAELSDARDILAARAEELSQLKDEAERANAAKTRFLAAASHDLRQPMHSISLLLGVLQSRLDSLEHVALADKIQSSVATMESLFSNLLDISKLDAGAMQAHVEDVNLGWLLHRLEQTWAPQATDKGLKLRVRTCNVVVKGDAALLERIIGNLLSNAIRYTRRGGVLVGCRRRAAAVELQVWDTGPGIAPRYRDAIFEEFFRIDAPGMGQEKGLGLGLSIVQRCAHLLGYGLSVDSRVDHGTVFRLTLPLSAATASLPRIPPRLSASQRALEGRFVVVVDDEDLNAQALVDALQACRCHVVAAESCDAMLAQLQQHLRVPDVIVTDYQLGGGRDGFEVISRLRQHYDDDIPALMVTANTDASLQGRAAEHGTRLLHKPIGLQRLLEAMEASLRPAGTS